MSKYTANAYLLHKGKIVQTGQEVELTAEQAKRLGDKVTPVTSTRTRKAETEKEENKKETK